MFVVDEAGIRIPPASSTSVVAGGGRHENCALFPRPARQPMTATQADPSLQALMLPFADGTLAWPRDGALFLRARDGWPLHERPLPRSEEHTSELQSLMRISYAVFCLKKTRKPSAKRQPLTNTKTPNRR